MYLMTKKIEAMNPVNSQMLVSGLRWLSLKMSLNVIEPKQMIIDLDRYVDVGISSDWFWSTAIYIEMVVIEQHVLPIRNITFKLFLFFDLFVWKFSTVVLNIITWTPRIFVVLAISLEFGRLEVPDYRVHIRFSNLNHPINTKILKDWNCCIKTFHN